jgi:predicted transcriptional regulator
MTEKPTLQQIRKSMEGQEITRDALARKAGLSYGEVYLADIGGYLAESKIKQVLWAFHELSGQKVRIKDIRHGSVH